MYILYSISALVSRDIYSILLLTLVYSKEAFQWKQKTMVHWLRDSLVGELEPEYSETALDRRLYQAIVKLDMDTKEKLLETIEL